MATNSREEDPVDIASDESFPASDPPARTATTGTGHRQSHPAAVDAEMRRSGLGWQHALMVAGAGMLAAGASVWKLRRRG